MFRRAVRTIDTHGYAAFVRRHADRLRGLMLVDTRAEPDTEEGRAGRHATAKIAREQGARPVVDAMLPRLVADATLSGRSDIVKQVLDVAEGATAEGMAMALEAIAARPSSVDLLPQITVPTLVIAGHDDLIVPLEASEANRTRWLLRTSRKNSTARMIPVGRAARINSPRRPSRWRRARSPARIGSKLWNSPVATPGPGSLIVATTCTG